MKAVSSPGLPLYLNPVCVGSRCHMAVSDKASGKHTWRPKKYLGFLVAEH
jgi:hypothetical protein